MQANRNPVRLRRFVPEDLAAMHSLDQICFRMGIVYSLEELKILTQRANSSALVAETGKNQMAGFCIADQVWRGGVKSGWIITLDVHPEFRRQGVGRLLMQSQESELVSHGVRRCVLEVAIDDPGAQEFYVSLGYQTTARLSGYYMDKLDALVMEKELGSAGT
jgi:ribosomal-protein-alanine N-acetyltransferase